MHVIASGDLSFKYSRKIRQNWTGTLTNVPRHESAHQQDSRQGPTQVWFRTIKDDSVHVFKCRIKRKPSM